MFYFLVEEEPGNKMSKLGPFTGSARRLDGQPSFLSQSVASSPLLKEHQPGVENGIKVTKSPSMRQSSAKPGKLVFGSNVSQSPTEILKVCLASDLFSSFLCQKICKKYVSDPSVNSTALSRWSFLFALANGRLPRTTAGKSLLRRQKS